jgi:hypothetical protein
MGAAENKTLQTKCGSCGKQIPTFVDPTTSTRTTWPLVGKKAGQKFTYAACKPCYDKGWRPPGFTA